MPNDYSHKNLQKASFINADLSNALFADSDLRGADLSGANLTGADLTHIKTGITPFNKIWMFLFALSVSLLAGYIAMLAGHTVQLMLASEDKYIRLAGIVTSVMSLLFILYAWWKGGSVAIRNFILPVVGISLIIGLFFKVSGIGTGLGMFNLILALILLVIMFIIGTVARTAAGTLSNVLFLVVALSGGMFGRSVGGGIGTVVMAIACMQISKRALSGAKGFNSLRKVASYITAHYGTSFRNAKLSGANFSQSEIHNADFSDADVSQIRWGDAKKINCITTDHNFTVKT